MDSLLSRSTDVKDQLTGEAKTWDLMTFVCTTLIRLSHYFFLSCLPEINKCSEVSVKLEFERTWKPTSCASSQLQRVRLFFFFLLQHRILWIRAPTVSLKFLGCFKIASMFFSSLCFFLQSLGQLQDYPVIISISAGDNEWKGTCVTCSSVTLQPPLLCGGASGMLSIRGLRFPERKIWRFFFFKN